MNCAHCGKVFEVTTSNKLQRFCCSSCQRKAAYVRRKDSEGLKIRRCAYCFEEFEVKFNHRIYCSKACSIKAMQERRLGDDEYISEEESIAKVRTYYNLAPIKKGDVTCLKCGKIFYSEDNIREQICAYCKDQSSFSDSDYIGCGASRNGNAYIELGIKW